jgi:hypothetical protein
MHIYNIEFLLEISSIKQQDTLIVRRNLLTNVPERISERLRSIQKA